MKQLTVTIPDSFYDSFVDFFKHIPNVSIEENEIEEVSEWQQKMVLDRIKNSKPEDYIDADEALKSLKDKYGF
ncbi:hypothetical protein [Flavobacterium sp.]|uniref:hypothetical protein n=1 Tax=Flavobacterium sp. TaxID=239 RepID=UPI003C48C085